MLKLGIFFIIAMFAGSLIGIWMSETQKRLDDETAANLAKVKNLRSARKQND